MLALVIGVIVVAVDMVFIMREVWEAVIGMRQTVCCWWWWRLWWRRMVRPACCIDHGVCHVLCCVGVGGGMLYDTLHTGSAGAGRCGARRRRCGWC